MTATIKGARTAQAPQPLRRRWQGAVTRACAIFIVMLAAAIALCGRGEASEDFPEAKAGATATASTQTNQRDTSGDYRLTPGDHVKLLVFDEAQLSGDFVVNGSGELLLPLAGAIDVGGLTLAEAQERIQERLADGILVQPTVSLRITEYRPIFIFGNVKKPGSYSFQFGQSVRAAIASAGGQGRLSDHPSAAMSQYIMAEERVRLLETRRLGLLVRKLRLAAEQNDAASFNVPQLIGYGTNSDQIGLFYSAENDVFVSDMDLHRGQLELLERQRPRFEAEMKAVAKQLANERRRVSFVQNRVAELGDYKSKGLVRTSVLNEQQREEARASAEVARLEAGVANLDRQMGDLDIRIEEAKASFGRQVMRDLHETIQNLREVEVTLQTSRALLDYRAEDAGITEEVEANTTILISRTDQQGVATTFDAGYDTLLKPGDVVEVKRKMTEPASRPDVSNEASLLPN
jgi:polysaccharide biosynthesis/export protein